MFDDNRHIARAELAMAKGLHSEDKTAAAAAYREAAKRWERAAARQVDARRKAQFEANANQALRNAEAAQRQPNAAIFERLARLNTFGGPVH